MGAKRMERKQFMAVVSVIQKDGIDTAKMTYGGLRDLISRTSGFANASGDTIRALLDDAGLPRPVQSVKPKNPIHVSRRHAVVLDKLSERLLTLYTNVGVTNDELAAMIEVRELAKRERAIAENGHPQ